MRIVGKNYENMDYKDFRKKIEGIRNWFVIEI